uniref:AAA-ATPase-like domain-containing protein n=1 Tax=Clastoptera arizonana TaxID=38151 RepID=A0A1B6CAZ9_9HEMI
MAPHGFGKSVNLEMLRYFLEMPVHSNGSEIKDKKKTRNFQIFSNLKIMKEQEFFEKHFAKYPIIFIDYKPLVNVSSYDDFIFKIKEIIHKCFKQHSYLAQVRSLWEAGYYDILCFKNYTDSKLYQQLDEYHIKLGLKFLSELLYEHFKIKPLALIDEYNSYINGIIFTKNKDISKITNLLKRIHVPFVKNLGRVFSTGVFYSTTDIDVNDFLFLHDHKFSKYYGLIEHELTEVLNRYTRDKDEVELLTKYIHKYYNGYKIIKTNSRVYNIYSTLKYLHSQQTQVNHLVKPNFYDSFLDVFRTPDIKFEIFQLIDEKSVVLSERNLLLLKEDILAIKSLIASEQPENINQIVYALLLQLGYLTYTEHDGILDGFYILEIPNEEMKNELRSVLNDGVLQQYNFDMKIINKFNNILDDIYEVTNEKIEFKVLLNTLDSLIQESNFTVSNINDFQTSLISILREKFLNVKSIVKEIDGSIFIRLKNQNDVTFFIETVSMKRRRTISPEIMKRCTEKTVKQIIKGYINKVKRFTVNNLICFGICVGVTTFKDGTIMRYVGLSLSKKFKPSDNINDITTIT